MMVDKKDLQKVIGFSCKKINVLRANKLKKFLDKELSNNHYIAINFEELNFIDSQAFDVLRHFRHEYHLKKSTEVDFIIPPGEIEELFRLEEDILGVAYNRYSSLEEFEAEKQGKVNLKYFKVGLRDEYR